MANPPTPTEYLAPVGAKVTTTARITFRQLVMNPYNSDPRQKDTMVLLKTASGHHLKWFATGDRQDLRRGDTVTVSGIVKENVEHNGFKQCVLTRCRTQEGVVDDVIPAPETVKEVGMLKDAWSAVLSDLPVPLEYLSTVLDVTTVRAAQALRSAGLLRRVPGGHEVVPGYESMLEAIGSKVFVSHEGKAIVVKSVLEHLGD